MQRIQKKKQKSVIRKIKKKFFFLLKTWTIMAPPSNAAEFDVSNSKCMENDSAEKLMDWEAPKAQGLYDPQNEHEACGVGFIVAIDGKRNHKVTLD